MSSLRNNISLVSQETTLFDDTILNNIKYANLDATDEQVKEAARLSYSEEFIDMLPKNMTPSEKMELDCLGVRSKDFQLQERSEKVKLSFWTKQRLL